MLRRNNQFIVFGVVAWAILFLVGGVIGIASRQVAASTTTLSRYQKTQMNQPIARPQDRIISLAEKFAKRPASKIVATAAVANASTPLATPLSSASLAQKATAQTNHLQDTRAYLPRTMKGSIRSLVGADGLQASTDTVLKNKIARNAAARNEAAMAISAQKEKLKLGEQYVGPTDILPSQKKSKAAQRNDELSDVANDSSKSSAAIESGWILQTLTALGVVIGLILLLRGGIAKFSGRSMTSSSRSLAEVLGRVSVAPRNQIIFVRTGRRILVLGDSPNGLRTLANLDDEEEVASLLAASASQHTNSITASFKQLLRGANDDADASLLGEGAEDFSPASEGNLAGDTFESVHTQQASNDDAEGDGQADDAEEARENLRGLLARVRKLSREVRR